MKYRVHLNYYAYNIDVNANSEDEAIENAKQVVFEGSTYDTRNFIDSTFGENHEAEEFKG